MIRFFWHQPYLVTTPPTGFLRFKKSIFKDIWEINNFFDFFDVFTPSLQVWWIFVENWWRNNLSKLTTFNPVFQLPHSAMVDCIVIINWLFARKNREDHLLFWWMRLKTQSLCQSVKCKIVDDPPKIDKIENLSLRPVLKSYLNHILTIS